MTHEGGNSGAEGTTGSRRLYEDVAFLVLALLIVILPAALRSLPWGKVDVEERAVRPAMIDINKAPWHEWLLIEGIGESRAKKLVEYRQAHGPFRSLDDLKSVPRMPEGWLEKARNQLLLEEALEGPK